MVTVSTTTDIDECEEFSPCEQNCTNSDGGFRCSCYPGFKYDQQMKMCKDINECDLGMCGSGKPDKLCLNTYGGFHCFGVNLGLFQGDSEIPQAGGVVAPAPETAPSAWPLSLFYGVVAGMFACLVAVIVTLAARVARRPSVSPNTPSTADPESLLGTSTVSPSTPRSAAETTITSL
ncbi:hypothetical protein NP493_547g01048 [Ridgeia piscesae]|uniref:EGF-like domain-containing protein n=1 Tax=Ridgeia piscesae TaxID=27915 RepID=A0AAD9NQ67_RIDPI|nr:hypothetical protein NP493_547g01048 [Ridgeia piscesae]